MPDELGGPCRCLAFSWSSANRWTFLLHSFSYLFCHCAFLFPTHSHRTRCCSHCTHGRVFPGMQKGKLSLHYYYYWHCWKSPSSREGSTQRLKSVSSAAYDSRWGGEETGLGLREQKRKRTWKPAHTAFKHSALTTHLWDLLSPPELCKSDFTYLELGKAWEEAGKSIPGQSISVPPTADHLQCHRMSWELSGQGTVPGLHGCTSSHSRTGLWGDQLTMGWWRTHPTLSTHPLLTDLTRLFLCE